MNQVNPNRAGRRRPPISRPFYDEMWRNYGHLDAVSPAAFHRRRIVVQLAVQFAGSSKNILDVGCGQGELLRELAEAIPGARVHGADLSEQSIIDTRKRNPTYDLFQLNLTNPDFDRDYADRLGKFEFVVCSEVIEHIPDDSTAAANLLKLLTPRGVAIVTVPGGKMSTFDKVIGHQRHYTPSSLESKLAGVNFQVEKVLAWGFPFHSFYRTAVRVASGMTMPKGPGSRCCQERTERHRLQRSRRRIHRLRQDLEAPVLLECVGLGRAAHRGRPPGIVVT